MTECPRCGHNVDTLHFVEPDMISTDLIDSMDSDNANTDTRADLEVCAECLNEVIRN